MTTDQHPAPTGSPPTDGDGFADGDVDTDGDAGANAYADAIEEYLAAATWLTVLEAPLKVHARSIARSLDAQLAREGVVQSALASSFDKVLIRLEARRPGARPAPAGDAGDGGGMGYGATPALPGFGFLSE